MAIANCTRSQALLAGDSASLADPLSGEGIRPAIFSGFKAAQAIDRALGGAGDAKRRSTLKRSPKNGELIWFGPTLGCGILSVYWMCLPSGRQIADRNSVDEQNFVPRTALCPYR
ncbi:MULTISPECIES: hypothetical protein [unclassified Microcoleus]|uniref:hypothetical protein n=1 Tax=unclassified Microcoleus TaxID=2642155 RepID=UPI002FCE7CCC